MYSIETLLDPTINFGKVTVSGGYDNIQTTINLNAGDGLRFPSTILGSFNVTWWNATDHPDPSDDPNREIVRVISGTGDTIIVMRHQEGTVATPKNLAGKTYKMILAITAKIIPDIQADAQSKVETHRTTGIHIQGQPPQLHGGESHMGNVTIVTANYVTTLNDDTIICNASATSFTVSLPNSSARLGKIYNIKKIDSSSNGIIIVPSGTETIEGHATILIQNQWDYYILQSTGTDWIILSSPTVISIGQLNEFVTNYNSPPQSGLTDTLSRSESVLIAN